MKIQVSTGEVVDKITILHLKQNFIPDRSKLVNIEKELHYLVEELKRAGFLVYELELYSTLYEINRSLWEVEDKLRLKEKGQEFDKDFIELARSVYKLNDKRAQIKKQINLEMNSELVEEKSYTEY